MKQRIAWRSLIVLGGIVAVLLTGCEEKKTVATPVVELPPVPPLLEDTVAEHARLLDAGYMPVTGYGLVIGLGEKGSKEVPPRLRTLMTKYLSKYGLGWWRYGLQEITPMVVLRDPDTAIVQVTGKIPAGAPAGTVFDVEVQAIGSDVTSLDGGALIPMELQQDRPGVDVANRSLKTWAEALGPVYINPFIDTADPANQSKLLKGRVVGGGKVTEDSYVYLQMLGAGDYAWASFIEKAINKRFESHLSRGIAKAKDGSLIQIDIPRDRRDRYRDFLLLVQHLPLRNDLDRYAKEMAQKLTDASEQESRTITLLLEALGKRSLAYLKPLYTHEEDRVAFFAAKAGLRLGDVDQAAMVLGAMAEDKEANYRYAALEELGRSSEVYAQLGMLRRQLDDPDAEVRLLAYNALLNLNDGTRITRHVLLDQIPLDIVESSGPQTIFATSSGEPRIVVFGDQIQLSDKIYMEMPGELLFVRTKPQFQRVKAWRKVPRKDSYTDVNTSTRSLHDFILMIGTAPQRQSMVIEHQDPETNEITRKKVYEHRGLALTYSQVIGVLQRMCAQRMIPATFVLR